VRHPGQAQPGAGEEGGEGRRGRRERGGTGRGSRASAHPAPSSSSLLFQVFYTTPLSAGDVRGFWCHGCYVDAARTDRLELEGTTVRRAELEKRKNDEELEEGWVQCDQCERWVHQICGLFNKGRNTGDAPYVCPVCLLDSLRSGQRKPIEARPQAMLEAKDLPKCDLSDFLEARLAKALRADAAGRARAAAGGPVPDPGGLTIRVINNVSKRAETKPRFAAAFKGVAPKELPFRQKVVMLFQKIDGVDVALYCLYLQEYGAECPAPNARWVYLSYLDSVKYFVPEVSAGPPRDCALRTLVYHEVLTAYLAYARAHGFTSMFIWACPPLQVGGRGGEKSFSFFLSFFELTRPPSPPPLHRATTTFCTATPAARRRPGRTASGNGTTSRCAPRARRGRSPTSPTSSTPFSRAGASTRCRPSPRPRCRISRATTGPGKPKTCSPTSAKAAPPAPAAPAPRAGPRPASAAFPRARRPTRRSWRALAT